MKRYTCYLGMILLLFNLNSCVWEKGYSYGVKSYNAGRGAFDYVEWNMSVIMDQFDIALRLNAYLAMAEEQREEAEDRYFPEYEIRPKGENEWIGLNREDTVFQISTGKYTLSGEGASWKYTDRNTKETTITYSGAGKWVLESREARNYCFVSNTRFEIENGKMEYPEGFQENDFLISGSGLSISCDEVVLDFIVETPLHKMAGSKYLFNEGSLAITATDKEFSLTELIGARLTSAEPQQRFLEIIYKGETYSFSESEP